MTNAELYNVLYTWVNQILNVEGGEGIEIIQANQNAPAPAIVPGSAYMVIGYAGNKRRFGRAHRTLPVADTEPVPDLVKIINDSTVTIEIREVGEITDRLAQLIHSTDRDSVQQYFVENKLSYLGEEEIQNIPNLDGNEWIKEAVVEIRLAVASQIETTEESHIETVEIESILEN